MRDLPAVPVGRSLARAHPEFGKLWASRNATPPEAIDPTTHILAWWRCPAGAHVDWSEYVDVVVEGNGQCPRCGPTAFREALTPTLSGRKRVGRCQGCGKSAILKRDRMCDPCLMARGHLRCPECGIPCSAGSLSLGGTRGVCKECRTGRRPKRRVRIVSGGLPTLGKRR